MCETRLLFADDDDKNNRTSDSGYSNDIDIDIDTVILLVTVITERLPTVIVSLRKFLIVTLREAVAKLEIVTVYLAVIITCNSKSDRRLVSKVGKVLVYRERLGFDSRQKISQSIGMCFQAMISGSFHVIIC